MDDTTRRHAAAIVTAIGPQFEMLREAAWKPFPSGLDDVRKKEMARLKPAGELSIGGMFPPSEPEVLVAAMITLDALAEVLLDEDNPQGTVSAEDVANKTSQVHKYILERAWNLLADARIIWSGEGELQLQNRVHREAWLAARKKLAAERLKAEQAIEAAARLEAAELLKAERALMPWWRWLLDWRRP